MKTHKITHKKYIRYKVWTSSLSGTPANISDGTCTQNWEYKCHRKSLMDFKVKTYTTDLDLHSKSMYYL